MSVMPRRVGYCDPEKMSQGDSDVAGAPVEEPSGRIPNVVTSFLSDGDSPGDQPLHAPVLDIDFQCFVVPSSRPGHYHLYLDHALTWEKYAALLTALGEAEILSPGFVHFALEREETVVRMPWVPKHSDGAAPAVLPTDTEEPF